MSAKSSMKVIRYPALIRAADYDRLLLARSIGFFLDSPVATMPAMIRGAVDCELDRLRAVCDRRGLDWADVLARSVDSSRLRR